MRMMKKKKQLLHSSMYLGIISGEIEEEKMERFSNAVSQAKRSLREVHKNPKLISFFSLSFEYKFFVYNVYMHACLTLNIYT